MDSFPIVAVASDASDLEAASELLSALPADFRAAVIIVQHPDEGREKSLPARMAKRTNLSVLRAHDDVKVERSHIYLVPLDATLVIAAGYIRLTPREKTKGPYHPGDALFTSLAHEHLACAVGVVLSGVGFDGAVGVRAIRQSGGLAFAQYPGSARFSSMPISAIETGCVDFVLRPYEIARELGHATESSSGVVRRALAGDRSVSMSLVLNGSDAPRGATSQTDRSRELREGGTRGGIVIPTASSELPTV
jgi:two-component system, chemotaxis family, CheB/CheR fusion protein